MYNYEFENLKDIAFETREAEDIENLVEYMKMYYRKLWNGHYWLVNNERIYPNIENGEIVSWEFD